ncbi:DUF3558 family protein [Mycobacteroides abscessus]|uniref:DUF3558 family protein n=1 Tax=Mycobacteroides abscessus TaxID=36809 RepID=UPI0027E22FA8|nr:DUF3558 family protein [Mycobacteroides abscessus]
MMRLGLALTAVAFAIAGCGPSTGITKPADVSGSASTSESTTATSQPQVSSTLTAPHPPPNHWNDGTSYDSCLSYTADQLHAWGVDPTTVDDVGIQDRQLRGCQWRGNSGGWFLELTVANTKVASYMDRELFNNPRAVTVGGLGGVQYDGGSAAAPSCTVILPSQQSTVAVLVVIVDPKRAGDVPDACAKSIEVATAVAPTLPK